MKEAILEGLLFIVGDEGLSLDQIEEILKIDREEAKALVSKLRASYENEIRGLRLMFLGDRFKLATKTEHQEYYHALVSRPDSNELSQAALECLAIVAYKEPVTRIELDSFRGVSSRDILKRLVAKGLLKELGRSDRPGRPILYGTTRAFYDHFGIANKDELPEVDFEVKEMPEEDLFE